MQIGHRIIYNKSNGKILNWCMDERDDAGLTQELIDDMRPTEIDFIDLEFGQINDKRLISVDVETKKLITENIVIPISVEQQQIIDLENQMLLMANNEAGGIL